MSITVMKQVLEALEATMSTHGFAEYIEEAKEQAITSLRQAIADAEKNHIEDNLTMVHEPVAWCVTYNGDLTGNVFENKRIAELCKRNLEAKYGNEESRTVIPFYTSPPQRQQEQEPTPMLFTKDINGNFHPYKEKGHTENCAAFADDCTDHLSPSRFGVGDSNSTPQRQPLTDEEKPQKKWMRNIVEVGRTSDQSVNVVFSSCGTASEFLNDYAHAAHGIKENT